MRDHLRKTKIVCTIGPSSSKEDILERLIKEGMDVARLNFSHGNHEFHRDVIRTIRRLEKRLNKHVAILQDLEGIKIRISRLINQSIELKKGSEVIIFPGKGTGDEKGFYISYPYLLRDVKKGERILLDDGLIELRVIDKRENHLRARVIEGGILREKKGVNLPDTEISLPSFTEKDMTDLEFGLRMGIDMVALSFVRDEDDVKRLRRFLSQRKSDIPIIAKIEKPEAIKRIDDIIDASDGIMVARGDLGVEMKPEDVPIVQKDLIKRANRKGRFVIIATQMLESMREHLRPTRAEVTDVANAVIDGTDAVMLSGETAMGMYPVESLRMMAGIITSTERAIKRFPSSLDYMELDIPSAIAHGAKVTAENVNARWIVAFTKSGFTARLISMMRPHVPVIAFTPSEVVLRRLLIHWGIIPFYMKRLMNTDRLINEVSKRLLKERMVKKGDIIIITGSLPPSFREGKTNFLKIHRV